MKTYVEETFKLQKEHDVSDATMEKYLYSNAARLLKVNEAGARKPDGSVAASVPA
jgi:hypothetical protein